MPIDILASSRSARRKKLFLKASFLLLGLFLFIGGIIIFLNIPKFRIRDISVEGAVMLNQTQFQAEISNLLRGKFFRIIPYDNIFILPKKKISANLLQKFPLIKNVSLKNNFSRQLVVVVDERKPEALWCLSSISASTSPAAPISDSCAFIDERGFIFQQAPTFSGVIFPKFFDERQQPADIGKEMIPDAEFQKLLSFSELLLKKDINVIKIILKDDETYEVYLKEGWYILLNSKNEPNPTFNNLELILDATIKEKRPQLEYIDLRFGNKVFYKLK